VKDRRHYGLLVREVVMDVTPEQAGAWLNTRPPAPVMWSRGVANNEKAHRLAEEMRAGRWDNDREWDGGNNRPNEPVMISEDHGYILGGHHRLTAVTILGKAQALRIRFYSKPAGYDAELRRIMESEMVEPKEARASCGLCGRWLDLGPHSHEA
jgi:hypothetical protein